MTRDYTISIYLDKRRKKANGTYPVKLRVFVNSTRTQKLYPTSFEFTEDEFKNIWETSRPRGDYKIIAYRLKALETHALSIADKMSIFSLEDFETNLLKKPRLRANDVVGHYRAAIDKYRLNNQINTALNYEQSLNSMIDFYKKDLIPFNIISPQWLKEYEKYMVETKGRSKTTVGIYLRPLRSIFNAAIANKSISAEIYPFGKRKYTIPAPRSTKKALTKDQLKLLFESTPSTQEQEKAKAFWFFSYSCNGMNFKDICMLQYKNIDGDTLQFRRAKTSNTNTTQSPVIVYLNEYTQSVIDKYGNINKLPDEYIFPIVDHSTSQEEIQRQLRNFVRFVNQHFSKFAKHIGIKENVSTYWARHSFATQAIRNGASMEYVSEALSHSSLNTTRNYFAGFEDEKKKEISKKMMEF